jgi:glycosyltransferase involved in cell wall biosynthesis
MLSALQRIGAKCPGFVEDLSTVLRPYDIHIVPWSHNTGVRTRIPLALNYGQALVAMRTTAACLDELRDGENCLLVSDFGEMAQAIRRLLHDDALRRRIADEGRKTFLACFTREGLQPRFDRFLRQFLVKAGQ